jgi:ribonuclease HI
VCVLHAELLAMIHAMEFAHRNSWHNLWIESDSTAALRAFSNSNEVPWDLRNRWSNCLHLGLHIATSHIYRKGNICADKIVNHGHLLDNTLWWDSIPPFIRDEFLRDRLGIHCFRNC